MKERSGMPYDVVAFETDEYALALTSQEEGIFHRMMRKAWINGSVPADLAQLAHLCRERPSTIKKAWPHLSKMWVPADDNPSRLVNKKQESERAFKEKIRVQNVVAGKLSAKSRINKDSASADVEQSLSERSTSLPFPSPSLLKKNTGEHGASAPLSGLLKFGEFGRAQMTSEQHAKLLAEMDGSLDSYIYDFDHWVNEAPDAKHNGVRRRDRHAYESISAWYRRDLKEGKVKKSKSIERKAVY